VQAFEKHLSGHSKKGNILLRLATIFVSLILTTVLFAATFKVLPDAKIRWKDAWILTQVYATEYGSKVLPKAGAERAPNSLGQKESQDKMDRRNGTTSVPA
jgi:hypothetical protein